MYGSKRSTAVSRFQGRYKAILVDGDSYLLELTRYVVLNLACAGMVELPGDWRWSSYLDMLGVRSAPHWLATDGLLAQFWSERQEAVRCYAQFVAEGIGRASIWRELNCQIYLGDDAFVERMQAQREGLSKTVGVPQTQKRAPAPPLAELVSEFKSRNEGIVAAYETGAYSYQQIVDF